MIKQNETGQNHFWSHLSHQCPFLCTAFLKERSVIASLPQALLNPLHLGFQPTSCQLCSCQGQRCCQGSRSNSLFSSLISLDLRNSNGWRCPLFPAWSIFFPWVMWNLTLSRQVLCSNSSVVTRPLLNRKMPESKDQVLGVCLWTYNSLRRWFIYSPTFKCFPYSDSSVCTCGPTLVPEFCSKPQLPTWHLHLES